MGRLFNALKDVFGGKEDEDSGDETTDVDAQNLSHVGAAAYECLRTVHEDVHHVTWDVTSGKVVGELDQTPKGCFDLEDDPPEGHSDWLPEKMAGIMERTEQWCDVMSLGPPDGKFLECMKQALVKVNARASGDKPVVFRFLFGNIPGMPVNCGKVLKSLTADLPDDPSILLWVGAWRNGVSWNHAKIIAVDGRYLHTGGHNLWDPHYLKNCPVHDLSFELEGKVAHAAHLFANDHWKYIEAKQRHFIGKIVDLMPDSLPMVLKARVTVSEYPDDEAGEFPPKYKKRLVPRYTRLPDSVPLISVGRRGQLHTKDNSSDDAFVAMIESANTILRLGLQDLGPVCIPKTKLALPGCTWPHTYLESLAKVIWEKGVDVEIVLSNPGSIPGGLSMKDANYGNGWSCVDVAAEIIKKIKKLYPDADDDQLRQKVADNLRVCFIRTATGNQWSDGNSKGMHAKHFIVDDVCCYIGSQNLYVCDLSEWGVIVDDVETTQRIKAEYWDPMWKFSYTGDDVDVQEVMDGLDIDRDGEDPANLSAEQLAEAARAQTHCPNTDFCNDHDSDVED
ncbi:Inherit from NOG: PLDc [Seminavis robusta]|uniref:Inherit from NOG: PLDc n=1 Tax=Seminavis robusta TaxID=568900 RepID=A0A9N8E501_9STRA|nr:Inherit from NOG: PLDc [Seminavis robusta]|eukprot:Sro548_g164360.1 Inherit from NOG: PLDc (563) ;mRNA; f:16118-18017